MSIEYLEYVAVGQHLAIAYTNDDYTGLTDQDVAQLEEYLADHGHFVIVTDDDGAPRENDFTICEISRKYDQCYYVKHQSL